MAGDWKSPNSIAAQCQDSSISVVTQGHPMKSLHREADCCHILRILCALLVTQTLLSASSPGPAAKVDGVKAKAHGEAVLVCPGGGFSFLAFQLGMSGDEAGVGHGLFLMEVAP